MQDKIELESTSAIDVVLDKLPMMTAALLVIDG
jgi:hypothetical protein